MKLNELIERLEELREYGDDTVVEVNSNEYFDIGYDNKDDVIYIES